MGHFEYVQCVIKALWEECLRRVSLNMSLAISCDWMSICSDWNNLGHDLHHLAFRSKTVQTFFGEKTNTWVLELVTELLPSLLSFNILPPDVIHRLLMQTQRPRSAALGHVLDYR